MNQQQIVNRVNQLSLGNRLTWYDIMYDADKAIAKINSYLGACYPNMSDILQSPEHTYSIYMDGKYVEIFPDIYMHTIVIPFIAMEVLARDEEFTTVYNKYMAEVEDGLFTMFQNEFNKVPLNFRQSKSTGVFFGNEQRERKITDDMDNKALVFKFRVYYHVNNEDIVTHIPIYVEASQVCYDEDYCIKSYNPQYTNGDVYMVSHDGTHYYKFLGWRTSQEVTTEVLHPGDYIEKVKQDIHLYAVWEQHDTLAIVGSSTLYIYTHMPEAVKPLITQLVIPTFYNGYLVDTLYNNFCGKTSALLPNLKELYISESIRTIGENAFKYFPGHTIEFSYSQMPITINAHAFDFVNPVCEVSELVIPTNVSTITVGTEESPTFNCPEDKQLTVYFRRLYSNIPESFGDVESPSFAGSCVKKVWGYNG